MMKALGYKVIHYGGYKSTAECDEYVPIVTEYEQNWVRDGRHYIYPCWKPSHPVWVMFNDRVAREVKRRGAPGDLVCVLGGNIFLRLEAALPGFKGSFPRKLKAMLDEAAGTRCRNDHPSGLEQTVEFLKPFEMGFFREMRKNRIQVNQIK